MKLKIYVCVTMLLASLTQITHAQKFVWGKSAGGYVSGTPTYYGSVEGKCIKTDQSGNVYTVGIFRDDVDFDPGAGETKLRSFGNLANNEYDVFITKLDPDGNFIWAKQLGGNFADGVSDITFDASGNSYITGYFSKSGDFDPGPATLTLTSKGDTDPFIVKLDPAGNLIWARSFGSSEFSDPSVNALVVNASGDVYITGSFSEVADFDPSPVGGYYTNTGGETDEEVYISKWDVNGNFVWVKQLDADNLNPNNYSSSRSSSLALDNVGNVIIAGTFYFKTDFDPGLGEQNLSPSGEFDGFILKLSPVAGNFISVKQLDPSLHSLEMDSDGNMLISGTFGGTMDFDPGPNVANLTAPTGNVTSLYVLKLNNSGNYIWAKIAIMGLSGNDLGISKPAIDHVGNICITGYIDGPLDFDPGPGTLTLTPKGQINPYIVMLDNLGNFKFAGLFDGYNHNYGYSITTDHSGNIYTTGLFTQTVDFDPTSGVNELNVNGGGMYIVKLGPCQSAPTTPVSIIGDNTVCTASSITYKVNAVAGAQSYIWTLPSGWTGSSTDTAITVVAGTAGGNITVKADNVCGSSSSKILAVTVNKAPNTPGTISGNTSVSTGSSNTYSVNAVNGATSYIWTLPVGWSGSSTTNTINATAGLNGGTVDVTANNICGSSAVKSLDVEITVTGINDAIDDDLVTIYPSPVKNEVTISGLNLTSSAQIKIVNLSGLVVKEIKTDAKNDKYIFDMSTLPSGFYFLKYNNRTYKIVKE